jgi:hypothetical protein
MAKNLDQMTDEELRELLSKPMPDEVAKQFLKSAKELRGIVAQSLEEDGLVVIDLDAMKESDEK